MRWLRMAPLLLGLLLSILCWTALPAAAQDAAVADAKHHTVEFENEQVRVLRYTIAPGEKTELHEHPNNVQVMLTDHNAKVTTPDGKTTEVHGKAGTVGWRTPTKHVVENIGDQPIVGVLIEPKKPASAAPAGVPDAGADTKTSKVEFENDQVRVIRYRFPPHYTSPRHGHADNVQVMLTDHDAKITIDGKTTDAHAKAGQVFWRKAVVHQVENTGDKDFEGIHVEMKGAAATASQ